MKTNLKRLDLDKFNSFNQRRIIGLLNILHVGKVRTVTYFFQL